jgi:hypothetical protein
LPQSMPWCSYPKRQTTRWSPFAIGAF